MLPVFAQFLYAVLQVIRHGLPLQPHIGGRLRYEMGDWQPPLVKDFNAEALPELPDWALQAAPAAPLAPLEYSPSKLGGAKTLPGEAVGDPDALKNGVLLHEFLERFPQLGPEDRAALAEVSMKLGEAMYKASQAEAEASASGEGQKDDDVVDADFTEVKDDDQKSA